MTDTDERCLEPSSSLIYLIIIIHMMTTDIYKSYFWNLFRKIETMDCELETLLGELEHIRPI